jgi:hypothetical protein
MTKEKAVELLYYWQRMGGDSFTCKLYSLIAKADASNKVRLAAAFPVEFETYCEWHRSPSEDEFFARYPFEKVDV